MNSKTKVKPLGDKCVVKPYNMERVSKGGLVIPNTHEGVQVEYVEVLRIGPTTPEGFEDLEVGCICLVPSHKGIFNTPDGEETVKVMETDKILAIIERG